MLDAVLGLGRGLGQRFTVVHLLPSAVLGLFVLALVWGGAPADAPSVDAFVSKLEALSVAEGVLLLVALIAFALLVQPLQLPLVRLLEGYWGTSAVSRALADRGRARHRRRRARLEARQLVSADDEVRRPVVEGMHAAWALERRYPPAPLVMPTSLGNALRAAEHRAGRRYGLDTVAVWPRLFLVLPSREVAVLADQRLQLDLAARFTVVLLVAALVSVVLLATHPWWLAVPAVAAALAWLSYRGAVSAAVAYGEGIASAFDLHRFELLTALRMPLPRTLDEERAANEQLSRFLLQPFAGRRLVYDHASATAAETADPAPSPVSGSRDG